MPNLSARILSTSMIILGALLNSSITYADDGLSPQTPRFDYAGPGAVVEGRIEQLAHVQAGSKLPSL